MALTLRSVKGSGLTNAEIDANFVSLDMTDATAFPDKATIVDADKLGGRDSVSGLAKMFSFTTIKTALASWLAGGTLPISATALTGPHNGTVGATTPAAGSFTTLSATATNGNNTLTLTNSLDGKRLQIENNSSGMNLYSDRNIPWITYVNGVVVTTVSPTGLAVTGALSATTYINPPSYTTATRPAYIKGAVIFDTTINKQVIGGATAWEAVTSA